MPGVLDDKTDVLLLGEFQSSNDVAGTGNVDGITGIVAQSAGRRWWSEGIT